MGPFNAIVVSLLGLPIAFGGGTSEDVSRSSQNILENASFEAGRTPWFSLVETSPYWMEFSVTDERAHSGERSARLELTSEGDIQRGVRVWGVIQELEPETIPKTISGHYRVEQWERGTEKQYLQVVVSFSFGVGRDPLQIAWVLCGVDTEPFAIGNRKFLFAGPLEPLQDEWIPFEMDVHEALRERWGVKYPATMSFQSVRIFFEARFDGYNATHADGAVRARVYFDDLYFGD